MSAIVNTAPIVTTVTKPATNPQTEKMPRDANAIPRASIQDFCEEYYEDILPIIMNKIRRDKRKEIHARLDFEEGSRNRRIREGSHYSSAKTLSARAHLTDLAKLTRQAQPMICQVLGIVLAIEAALTGGTLQIEIVLKVETAPATSRSHIITPILLSRQLPNLYVLSKTRSNNFSTTSSLYLNQF
nr:hypothetical protein [Tanacetum cinerariifolium]